MTEYTIISGQRGYQLIKGVNEKLQEGWECIGGVQVVSKADTIVYFQSMIKKDVK